MEKQARANENVMGTEQVRHLLLRTGIPLMLSLLINSLYNFVDSVFVSQVAEDALTALSLAAPVQTLISALGLGNAVGLNAAISKALGEKRADKVKKTASAAIFLAVCAWMLISVTCLIGVGWYFDWQSGGNETIAAYGRDYLSICMLFSLGQMGQWVFDRFVIASGKSNLFLFTLSAASITNLILDPIFIFGFHMGTRGAAIATVIGQFTGWLAGILINRRWNREIPFSFTLRPDWKSVRTILRVGIPSTLVQVLTSFVAVVMNSILLAFSSTAVAVYGICARMQGLCTVGVHGIDNGLIPIVAYNYGAKKPERVRDAVRWGLVYSFLFYALFLLVLELMPENVLRLFNASDYMMGIGVGAVRLFALAWLISIPNLVIASALQGLLLPLPSMVLTMLRQAVLPVLLALLVQGKGELTLVWAAFAVSEAICVPGSLLVWKKKQAQIAA
ncbi:MAG: MATE family efflux transporter [Clostridia bacterium]|nr:MATE family efflux transporter [Clostridia bacterium]MBR1686055.1 MATE family efflux transporter [Clostridia bacterium]MBR2287033.1 MATE family efflux transporter [Clostridia bacterium]